MFVMESIWEVIDKYFHIFLLLLGGGTILVFGIMGYIKRRKNSQPSQKSQLESPSIQNEEKVRYEGRAASEKIIKQIEEAYTITRKFGEVLSSKPPPDSVSVNGILSDENLLPYPKGEIKWALTFRAAFELTFKDHWFGEAWVKTSQATLENCRITYQLLANFVSKEDTVREKEFWEGARRLAQEGKRLCEGGGRIFKNSRRNPKGVQHGASRTGAQRRSFSRGRSKTAWTRIF